MPSGHFNQKLAPRVSDSADPPLAAPLSLNIVLPDVGNEAERDEPISALRAKNADPATSGLPDHLTGLLASADEAQRRGLKTKVELCIALLFAALDNHDMHFRPPRRRVRL